MELGGVGNRGKTKIQFLVKFVRKYGQQHQSNLNLKIVLHERHSEIHTYICCALRKDKALS